MIPRHIRSIVIDFINSEKFQAALDILEATCGTEPDDPEVLATMGLLHFYLGNPEIWETYLYKSVEGESVPFEVNWIWALIDAETGNPDIAIDFWQEVIDRGVDSFYFEGRDVEDAKTCINDCRYMLSDMYYDLGKKHIAAMYKRAYLRNLEEGTATRCDPDMLRD
jgi:hypothetical protein